ncbi:hypothetical protein SLEP1_g35090 [Rubroshorea leprosula]|uniref:Uncharacterized protein n=1 Tax=Rubroshorea leprosula TaxID=152421 RepID=A0AAV5KMG1_9ROSI|nr:hypothetical protein SLEP1_g35090 [Rubroshorea leprosula]
MEEKKCEEDGTLNEGGAEISISGTNQPRDLLKVESKPKRVEISTVASDVRSNEDKNWEIDVLRSCCTYSPSVGAMACDGLWKVSVPG